MIENDWIKEREELLKKIKGLEEMCNKAARVIVKLKKDRDAYRDLMEAIGGRG